MTRIQRSIVRNATGLALFAMVTAGVIALTHAFTEDRIAQQAAKAEASALTEIIPNHLHSNNLLDDTITVGPSDKLGLNKPAQAHLARQEGAITGIILPVIAENGYSGDIHLLVGMDTTGQVLGVRVTRHHETPGLGDKIEASKSDWVYSFSGASLSSVPQRQWAVSKDGGKFDQFTGATITPRAVVSAVYQALKYFEDSRARLLSNKRP